MNDFSDAGYDSNTNKPYIYGIRAPPPGDYTIETEGTGTGPYTITIYGANLGTGVITRTLFTGGARQFVVTRSRRHRWGRTDERRPYGGTRHRPQRLDRPADRRVLVLRYLFGFRGGILINEAVAENCTRCDAPEIEAHLAGLR